MKIHKDATLRKQKIISKQSYVFKRINGVRKRELKELNGAPFFNQI